MIEKLKNLVLNIAIKKYVLGWASDGFKKAEGYKTQICAVLWVGVYVAQLLGYIDPQSSEAVRAALAGAGGLSFAAKIARYKEVIESNAGKVRETAQGK